MPARATLEHTNVDEILRCRHMWLARTGDAIYWVVFDKDGADVNLIDRRWCEDLAQIVTELERVRDAQAIVLWSAKKRSFIAGADVAVLLYELRTPEETATATRSLQALFDRIERLRPLTVAALGGVCLGGGFEMALACRRRVALASPSVKCGLPEVKLGICPGAGGTVRLVRLLGVVDALPLLVSGRILTGEKAIEAGIVDDLLPVSDYEFFNAVHAHVREILSAPAHYQPKRRMGFRKWLLHHTFIGRWMLYRYTMRQLSREVTGNLSAPFVIVDTILRSCVYAPQKALDAEAEALIKLGTSREATALQTVFVNNKNAKHKALTLAAPFGERSQDFPQYTAVIGAGEMGRGIAYLLSFSGIPVYLKDIYYRCLSDAKTTIHRLYEDAVFSRRKTLAEAKTNIQLMTTGVAPDDVKNAEFIVESVPEKLLDKHRAFAELEKVARPNAIIATNTSSQSIRTLTAKMKTPHRVVGLHFGNPAHKVPCVEVVRGKQTSDEAVAAACHVALKLGKVPVVCGDGEGFVVNRVLFRYLLEGCQLAEEIGSMEAVDKALADFGMLCLPGVQLDLLGFELVLVVCGVLHYAYHDRYPSPRLIEQFVDIGLNGKRQGGGFYTYDGAKKSVNPAISSFLAGPGFSKPSKEAGMERCIFGMINEAAYVLQDSMVESAAELDVLMVNFSGFAPMKGGPLYYADCLGLRFVVQRLEALQQTWGERFHPCPLLRTMAERGDRFYPGHPLGEEPTGPIVLKGVRPTLGEVTVWVSVLGLGLAMLWRWR
eukprot:TRINITY_DN20155_c0_g1_i1.p1 TRINITY_DN20155_c0_g1~~TRINITY_DN20155_c0_g1_i1.p1  ORF type:complete len:806 (+),score=170.49 TRINITY_DN20155_c0_g1_i1:99-2420(+)